MYNRQKKMDVQGAIRDYLVENCNFSDSWLHITFAIILYSPTVLTFIFFGVSYYTKQVFYLIMSMALSIDSIVNLLISNWIPDAAPVETCGGPRAFPSFFMEHSAFLFTYLLFSSHLFHLHVTLREIAMLQIWMLLTWIASVELGYNTFKQALVGAIIGHTLAMVCVLLIYVTKDRIREHMFYRGLLHRLGYVDSIFENSDAKIVLSKPDFDSVFGAQSTRTWEDLLSTYDYTKQKYK